MCLLMGLDLQPLRSDERCILDHYPLEYHPSTPLDSTVAAVSLHFCFVCVSVSVTYTAHSFVSRKGR